MAFSVGLVAFWLLQQRDTSLCFKLRGMGPADGVNQIIAVLFVSNLL